jgi:divalent metal cation (Fe/Co/Zn/Cd) transporter
MRLIAITFLVLTLYILFQLVKKLLFQEVPYPSLQGIIIAVASTIVMPLLSYQKYQTGKQISSKALMADSKETLACFFLSLALLFGLGLNYLLGF